MAEKLDTATTTMIRNLEAKTGRSLPDWVSLARGLGALKHGELVRILKERHGLTHGYANLVAHSAGGVLREGAPEGDDLVTAQYAGEKTALRVIYERILGEVSAFGPDVEIAPKKAYVSLRRLKQFALVQPTTKNRLDVGINLKGVPPAGRLEASGSFNSMVSHRVRLESEKDVDAELVRWLRAAYEGA